MEGIDIKYLERVMDTRSLLDHLGDYISISFSKFIHFGSLEIALSIIAGPQMDEKSSQEIDINQKER
jgi:hypothetical protein